MYPASDGPQPKKTLGQQAKATGAMHSNTHQLWAIACGIPGQLGPLFALGPPQGPMGGPAQCLGHVPGGGPIQTAPGILFWGVVCAALFKLEKGEK